jgi:hypothetical protein
MRAAVTCVIIFGVVLVALEQIIRYDLHVYHQPAYMHSCMYVYMAASATNGWGAGCI